MVNPDELTNFNRSTEEAQELMLFSVLVANKPAKRTSELLERFLNSLKGNSPFDKVKKLIKQNKLLEKLQEFRTGQYTRIEKSLRQLVEADLDVRKCSVEDLEKIHGIGPKTARMIVLHSQKDKFYCVLDTHLLKFLRDELKLDAPKTTPSGKKYKELEQKFLDYAKKVGKLPANLDLEIWKRYAHAND